MSHLRICLILEDQNRFKDR